MNADRLRDKLNKHCNYLSVQLCLISCTQASAVLADDSPQTDAPQTAPKSTPKPKSTPVSTPSQSEKIGIVGLKFSQSATKSPRIMTVFPDGPAWKAQLRAHDIITYVDGVPTAGLTKEEIYGMLVGEPGSRVEVTIKRGTDMFVRPMTRMSAKDFAALHSDLWKAYEAAK